MTTPLPIKIRLGPTGTGAKIEIDGEDMSHYVAGFEVRGDIHSATEVRLDFVNVEVEIDGTVDVTALGNEWTTYRMGRLLRDEMIAASNDAYLRGDPVVSTGEGDTK